jgi:hypothetical protein
MMVTIYKDYYDRAIQRVKSSVGRRMKKLRQSTVEPVFGSLLNYYGMSKVNAHGIDSAHKVMLMAAIAYNVKKYMKYAKKNARAMAMKLATSQKGLQRSFFAYFRPILNMFLFPETKKTIILPN